MFRLLIIHFFKVKVVSDILDHPVIEKKTSIAVFLINAFAGSDQTAGTVTTHLISVISISVCCFLTSLNSEFTKNLSDSEKHFSSRHSLSSLIFKQCLLYF